MSVHYKFKSTLHFDTITFDGLHISVADLKREIIQQKRLGKIIDFDLQITNAQNKEEYKDDNFLIPKNTTLIISRIPIAHPVKKGWDPAAENTVAAAPTNKTENLNMDLFKMQGSEEEKIQAMMMQSTADYDPKTYHRIKGQSQVGEVPASYRCNKCKRGGHWIKNCTFAGGKEQYEVKRTTGIPRSFRGKPEISIEPEASKYLMSTEKEQEIPEDLICGICRNIFVDAVMIPCCGSSFCDDCVRTSLLESEDSECPDCKEKNCSPGSLIPNRFLRNSVNVFKNESGYKLAAYKPVSKATPPAEKKEDDIAAELPEESSQTQDEEPQNEPEENKLETEEKEDEEEDGGEDDATEASNINSIDPIKKDNDSDFEDNITIKMPQKLIETTTNMADAVKEEAIPSYSQKSHGNNVMQRRDHNYEYKSDLDMKPQSNYPKSDVKQERSLLPTPVGTHHKPQYPNHNMNDQRDKPVMNPEQDHRMGIYKPPYMQMPRLPAMHQHMAPYNNGYNNIQHRPPMSFGHYQNQPVHQINAPYIPPGNMNINPSQTFQSSNLASIYQGVAAKVGTGLIDDPLEAFNRIMKEKEKQKVERRRSPGHHRSRSPGRPRHRFKSLIYDRGSSREMSNKEKRPRSRERKREYSYERGRPSRLVRHSSPGSNSPSDKKKRYVHRRSPSPKQGHKQRLREKSLPKPLYGSKPDTVEPPPPGFESLPIENIADNDRDRNKKPVDHDIVRNAEDDHHSRKRQRPSSKTQDTKTDEHSSKSLTPPSKSKTAKIAKIEGPDLFDRSPKTPERNEKDSHSLVMDKHQSELSFNPENKTNIVKPHDRLETGSNTGKENNLQSKDRKKKKKEKSERKKNKKDKKEKDKEKEKRDKVKKVYSESVESASASEKGLNLDAPMDPCNESAEFNSNDLLQNISDCIELETLKRNDSILSIEMTDHDLNREHNSSIHEMNDIKISKWELDDSNLNSNFLDPSRKVACNKMQDHSEITSDVLRKAEHAIFAKAINAIRPVEFKVVIDAKRSSKDRSITVKNDHKDRERERDRDRDRDRERERDRSHSPKASTNKSVKERLGNKVVNERNYSSDRSKNDRDRRENSERKSSRDRYKYSSSSYSSRKREKDSKERVVAIERRFDDQRNRKSTEREVISISRRDSNYSDSNKYKSQNKDKSSTSGTKSDKRNYESDRSPYRRAKSGESRLIASIASRPSKPVRPDNPFRKFDENNSSSNKVSKFDNSLKRDGTSQSSDQGDNKRRKDKKLKKEKILKKASSTESVKSDKRKDVKSKKKNKILKKKKKSRK
ncbi:LOW QUALITY PROTEIN: uncharacterized protein LOC133845497 [Drosophila sulfurigaster albostrigata]|uniref:LOW QUALITY PROTEIN: uncharacterized protein LOC133845497 n=1 Tax=Drosophila sulfurigaster albostrigata TaxID=89887 RepID=UPI002D21D4B7|nr:LOW QUALITY PROTEIN: uncharacterized protein LOC133845497 [Drosophila sulfurigaster albostrigata]